MCGQYTVILSVAPIRLSTHRGLCNRGRSSIAGGAVACDGLVRALTPPTDSVWLEHEPFRAYRTATVGRIAHSETSIACDRREALVKGSP
jgi:hypothetical protein